MSSDRQRELGSFYTPPGVALALTRWAVREPDCTVFDPSYGGCAFFTAAFQVLSELDSCSPASQIYGVDVDENAQKYLSRLLDAGASPRQFKHSDFFQIGPSDFVDGGFRAVVGNPPFIRYHWIEEKAKKRAKRKVLGIF